MSMSLSYFRSLPHPYYRAIPEFFSINQIVFSVYLIFCNYVPVVSVTITISKISIDIYVLY